MDNSRDTINHKNSYDMNGKVMLTAIFSLTFVIILITILHLYARCFLRAPRRPTIVRLSFTVAEPPPVKSGLDPTEISLLPTFLFKQSETQELHHVECAVCLSMLEEDEMARKLPNCNHIFHVECIDMWLIGQPTCPVCRSEVTPPVGEKEVTIGGELEAVVVDVVASSHEDHEHDTSTNVTRKVNSGSGPSSSSISSSSFRLSSFRRIFIGRDTSSSSRRFQARGESDIERHEIE